MKIFKKVLLVITLSLLSLAASAQKDTLRILAIGNSFSVDAIEQNLWEIFDAAGIPVVIGNMYIGGCSLERHYNNSVSGKDDYRYGKIRNGIKTYTKKYTLEQALSDEKWDYVSVQQNSGNSGIYSTYQPFMTDLLSYCKARLSPETKIMFHMTWSYAMDSDHKEFYKYKNDQKLMYKRIVKAVRKGIKENGIEIVIPNGTAIQNARTTSLGDTFNRDGYHLELTYGRYTAACTWFETITGKTVVGNSYLPAKVDPATALLCQKSAHAACLRPWKVTKIK